MIQELDNIAGTPLPETPANATGQSIQEAAPVAAPEPIADAPPAPDVPPVIAE